MADLEKDAAYRYLHREIMTARYRIAMEKFYREARRRRPEPLLFACNIRWTCDERGDSWVTHATVVYGSLAGTSSSNVVIRASEGK